MKKVKLTKGKYAIVDDKDYKLVRTVNWFLTHHGYAKGWVSSLRRNEYMHRFILGSLRG